MCSVSDEFHFRTSISNTRKIFDNFILTVNMMPTVEISLTSTNCTTVGHKVHRQLYCIVIYI